MIKHLPKRIWGWRGLICFKWYSPSLRECDGGCHTGAWKRDLKQRPQRNTATAMLPGLLSSLSYNSGLPAQRWHRPSWAGPPHISRQSRTCPPGLPTAQSDGGNFSNEVPPSQVCQTDNQDLPSQVDKGSTLEGCCSREGLCSAP